MTTRLAFFICISVLLTQSAYSLDLQEALEPMQTRGISINQEEVTVVPLTFTRAEYLVVATLTSCEGKEVSFAVLSSLDALSTASKWTQVNEITSETIHIKHQNKSKGTVYLALKHNQPVNENSYSFLLLKTNIISESVSPTQVFSAPTTEVQWQWNATFNKLNATWPALKIDDKDAYAKLMRQMSKSHMVVVTYKMVATVSEKFTKGMARCDMKVKGHTGLIEATQTLPTHQDTVSFEFQPTEPVYYVTLVASVSKVFWNDYSRKSWEISYAYPVAKYEVPSEYIQSKNE